MKQLHKLLSILPALLIATLMQAQVLNIGETMKEADIPLMLNYKTNRAKLSGFKGKPLLITFWNTHCTDAVEFLPKLAAMQKQAGYTFNILVVAHEPQRTIEKAFREKQLLTAVHLPMAVADTAISQLFPHRSEPHIVWINSNGMVRAITADRYVTMENLSAFIKDKVLDLPVKRESMDPDIFFSLTPLMVNDYESNKAKLLCSSYLGGYREGIMSGLAVARYDTAENVVRIHAQNCSISALYKLAYKKFFGFHDKRIILTANNAVTNLPVTESYCYDLLLKDTSRQRAYAWMIQDLDRFFGWQSFLEKRKIKTWVLKRTTDIDKLRANPRQALDSYFKDDQFIVHGIRLETLLQSFNRDGKFPFPIIDETGYKEKVDLVLSADFKNFAAVRKSLSKYDLDLVEEKREMEVIVLQPKSF